MSRRILLVLAPLLLAAAVPAHAQPRNEFAWQYMQSERPPGPPPTYIANMQPSSRFPITVQLRTDKAGVRGDSFIGRGVVHVFDPRGENLNFHYRCGIAFPAYRPTEFYARWVTPGRKLEITLLKPGTNHTGTCRITTSPPSSSAAANSTP